MRLSFVIAFFVTIVCLVSLAFETNQSAQASLNGRTGFSGNPATNGGQDCTVCHNAGAQVPAVALSGPTTIGAGETGQFTLTLSGGPAQVAGANISTGEGSGTLTPLNGELQLVLGELTHSSPKSINGGTTSFSFAWTAPSHNHTAILYAAGNSADGNQDIVGDGVATTTLAVQVTGGDPEPPAATATPTPSVLTLQEVASGLNQPVDIQNAGDDRLFVVEKFGSIRIIDDSLLTTPFLNIADRVVAGGGNAETGLLGLAFHPNYPGNGYFYVNYTAANPRRTHISRFSVSADPNVADPDSEVILMAYNQPFVNHNGGQLQFGPDGYLYIGSGDGGSSGDPGNRAQTGSTPLGKILRIDVDQSGGSVPDCHEGSGTNYSIPSANPFVDGPGGTCDEIWATGLRNPWRFSFDRLTGEQWIADVGQNRYEEINVATPGVGGQNYGWRCYEATTGYNTSGCGAIGDYTAPLFWYDRAAGDCSVTGGYVYRGAASPILNGHYFFADFCNGTIRSLSGAPNPDEIVLTTWTRSSGGANITTFGEDVNGEIYVGFLSGQVARIVGPPTPELPTATPTQAPATPTSTPPPSSNVRIALGETLYDGNTQTFGAPVEIADLTPEFPLGALTLVVNYDAASLQVVDCLPANQLYDSFLCNRDEPGIVRISALAPDGVTAGHVLAVLVAKPVGLKRLSTEVGLDVAVFADVNGLDIAVASDGGPVDTSCYYGDVDCSGVLDEADAAKIVQLAAGLVNGSDQLPISGETVFLPGCDANADGQCTAHDGMLILQCVHGQNGAFCPTRK